MCTRLLHAGGRADTSGAGAPVAVSPTFRTRVRAGERGVVRGQALMLWPAGWTSLGKHLIQGLDTRRTERLLPGKDAPHSLGSEVELCCIT